MAFEIVAGFCVLYIGLSGIIGYFKAFNVKLFDSPDPLENMFSRSPFIEKHLLIPMLSYQFWNFLITLVNHDLYTLEMVIIFYLNSFCVDIFYKTNR